MDQARQCHSGGPGSDCHALEKIRAAVTLRWARKPESTRSVSARRRLPPMASLRCLRRAGTKPAPSVVGLRTPESDLAVLYFSAGGAAKIKPDSLSGSRKAQWFNPRTGEYSATSPDQQGGFVAPDKEDWTLLLAATGAAQAARINYTVTENGLEIEGVGADNPADLRQRLVVRHAGRELPMGQGHTGTGQPPGAISSLAICGTGEKGICTNCSRGWRMRPNPSTLPAEAASWEFRTRCPGATVRSIGPQAANRGHEDHSEPGQRIDRRGGPEGHARKAPVGLCRRAAEDGRERLFDGPDHCGADGRLHDRPSRLQRHGPLGQLHRCQPLQARQLWSAISGGRSGRSRL